MHCIETYIDWRTVARQNLVHKWSTNTNQYVYDRVKFRINPTNLGNLENVH